MTSCPLDLSRSIVRRAKNKKTNARSMTGKLFVGFMVVVLLCTLEASSHLIEDASEELWIRPLVSQGRVATQLEFSVNTPSTNAMHTHLFPKAIAQILHKYQATELKLMLTSGHWDIVKWGSPLASGPFGAEIWAKIERASPSVEQERWRGLKAEMAAIFSVSLGLLDETRTVHVEPS